MFFTEMSFIPSHSANNLSLHPSYVNKQQHNRSKQTLWSHSSGCAKTWGLEFQCSLTLSAGKRV
jgi:hypothetical protein